MCEQRPPLLEAAEIMGAWWQNGKTGDVLDVSMPTRFGKSTLATAFSLWVLLNDFDCRVLRVSYAAELAESFSDQVRKKFERLTEYMDNPPKVSGTRARWKIGERDEDSHAGCGIAGGITGFGFDVAIIDDTAKNMLEATSAAYSRQLQVFKESVLLGRLEGRRKILNVGTRWTVNDWFSMWPDAESYVLPAMINGKSCCEAWKTTAVLELERSRVSDSVWNAQYMQQPTETGQVRLFEGWKPKYVDEIPDGSHYIVIDPATDYGRDYFVMGDYVWKGGLITLVDMFAEQRATPEEAARWLAKKEYEVAWCESNGAGANVIEKMRQAGAVGLAGFSTNRDKYSRAYIQSEAVKNYLRVWRGCNPSAVAELARQMDAFPVTGDDIHDDLVDDVVMAFERLYRI